MRDPDCLQLPLFAVADHVHFPCTELSLQVLETADRQLVRDLLAQPPESRLLGIVLLKPAGGHGEVFGAGTCARVTRIEPEPEGVIRLHLRGAVRFAIEEESPEAPYRRAMVRLVAEPELDEGAPEVRQVRRRLEERLLEVRDKLGDHAPIGADEVGRALAAPFEEMVNRVATALDVPPLRKLELLACSLPERAEQVLGILRSRLTLARLLGPYRHLAAAAEWN